MGHRRLSCRQGSTLFGVILSFGIFGLSMFAFTSSMSLYRKQQEEIKLNQKTLELKRLIQLHLKNPTAWMNTLRSPSNPEMACLVDINAPCQPLLIGTTGFNLFDSSGQMVVDSSSSEAGFDLDLKPCSTHLSNSPACPFKVTLTWEPQCATHCESPLIRIRANIQSKLGLSTSRFSGGDSFSLNHYVNINSFIPIIKTEFSGVVRCVLTEPGDLKCFKIAWYGAIGPEIFGQGLSTTTDISQNVSFYSPSLLHDLPPIQLGSGLRVKDFTIGGHLGDNGTLRQHACALLSNDRVKCWGSNDSGQLGLGHTEHMGDEPNEMGDSLPFVDLGSDANGLPLRVKQLTSGNGFTCALFFSGQVKCWGRNGGRLGLAHLDGTVDVDNKGDQPGEMGDALPFLDFGRPGPMAPSYTSAKILASNDNACSVLNDGQMKCWGDNDRGQLGIGNAGFTDASNVTSYNFDHTSILTQQPALDANGNPIAGQFVLTSIPPNPTLPQLTFYGNDNNADFTHTSLQRNSLNETLANLPTIDFGIRPETQAPRKVTDVSIGMGYICATLEAGELVCWGANYYSVNYLLFGIDDMMGFLGREGSSQSSKAIGDQAGEMGDALVSQAVQLGSFQKAKRIFSGGRVNCALLRNDQAKCFGSAGLFVPSILGLELGRDSQYRSLGDEAQDMGDNLPFVELGTSETVRQVSIGVNEACAVLSSGRMKCWGFGWLPPDGNMDLGVFSQVGDSALEMGNSLRYIRTGARYN